MPRMRTRFEEQLEMLREDLEAQKQEVLYAAR